MSERSGMKAALPLWLPSAVSALVLGAQAGCDPTPKSTPQAAASAEPASKASAAAAHGEGAQAPAPSLGVLGVGSSHAAMDRQRDCCMGKNDCKGKGGCAVPESHACRGQNDCKGKGGCNGHCPRE